MGSRQCQGALYNLKGHTVLVQLYPIISNILFLYANIRMLLNVNKPFMYVHFMSCFVTEASLKYGLLVSY